jgi:hypothetical protein
MANAQRIVPGFPFAFYMNETATAQRIVPGAYMNETIPPPSAGIVGRSLNINQAVNRASTY